MPPVFAPAAAVTAGILFAHFFCSSVLFWTGALGISILGSCVKSLKYGPVLAAFLCAAGLRCSAVEFHLRQDPTRYAGSRSVSAAFYPAGEAAKEKGFILRNRFRNWLEASLAPPYNGLALGVVLGDHASIPPRLLDEFRVTGTYHVLVASGLKVALAAGGALLLTWFCPLWLRLSAAAAAVVFYAALAGFLPPVLRAGLMALLGLTAFLLGRGKETLSAFFLAGLILLFLNPLWLFDAGFQLSFLSVLGILLFFEPISLRLGFLPRWVADSIAVSLSAQALILVPLAFYFHTVSLVSVPANLFAVPLTAVSMFLGGAGFALSFLWRPLAFAFSYWNEVVLRGMAWMVRWFARLPWAFLWVRRPGILTSFLVYLFFFGLFLWRKAPGKIAAAGSLAALSVLWIFGAAAPGLPRIAFLAGGDCTLLSFHHRHYLVEDPKSLPGRFAEGERAVVPALRERGINVLDGIFLARSPRTSSGGLSAVLENFRVKRIWLPPAEEAGSAGRMFLDEMRERKVPVEFVHGIQKVDLFPGAGVVFFGRTSQWQIDGIRILLAGNVQSQGEQELLRQPHARLRLQSQILEVPRGGGLIPGFLRRVGADAAVVPEALHQTISGEALRRLKRKIPYVESLSPGGALEFVLHLEGPVPWMERL